jgi:hypothetical protein
LGAQQVLAEAAEVEAEAEVEEVEQLESDEHLEAWQRICADPHLLLLRVQAQVHAPLQGEGEQVVVVVVEAALLKLQ